MTFRKWECLLVAAVLLGGCSASAPQNLRSGDARRLPGPLPETSSSTPFSDQEVRDFLTSVAKAEGISDPLQRCLKYPDPPGSHWSKAAIEAYCQYRLQPVIEFTEVKALVNAGHASELDSRLAAVLNEEFTKPERRGALERQFAATFSDVSPYMRATLDEWKLQSPDSAFAYAASGFNYESAAFEARGKKEADVTPAANFESMNQLAALAVVDLQKSLRINARVMPAYAKLIEITAAQGDTRDAIDIAHAGLAVDPTNFYIYSHLLWSVEPRWGGSKEVQKSVVASAQAHAAQNPVLLLLQSQARIDAANLWTCDCESPAERNAYRFALDEVASADDLRKVGANASDNNQQATAAVFLSEAVRFDSQNEEVSDARTSAVNAFMHDSPTWPLTSP